MNAIEATLKECIQSPEVAMRHLPKLLDAVCSTDEDLMEQATEALENAGVPPDDALEFLRSQLVSTSAQRIYWTCTLLGRMNAKANSTQGVLLELIVGNPLLEMNAKERAAWCLGQIGPLSETVQVALEKKKELFSPRLKRLVESALTSSAASG